VQKKPCSHKHQSVHKLKKNKPTAEPQYDMLYEVERVHGRSILGIMANQSWNEDPKRHLFTLARYKFVAKILDGKGKVLEVGCADAFGTRLVQQTVGAVTVIDMNDAFIADIHSRVNEKWPMKAFVHDMLDGPFIAEGHEYEAAFTLDVLEHIDGAEEDLFISNICGSITKCGVAIFGMPSLESQRWASPQSIEGHVNCKSGAQLKNTLEKHFHNVFVFSMNDEVVHTGFYPMAHYLLAVCCTKIEP